MSSGFREIQRVRLANEEEEKQMVKELAMTTHLCGRANQNQLMTTMSYCQ